MNPSFVLRSKLPALLCGLLVPATFAALAHAQVPTPPPVVQTPPPFTPTAIIVVDASGGGNYTTITAAVNAAPTGAWIQVKAGTYVENLIDLGYKELVLESVDGIGAAIVDGTPIASNKSIFVIQHFQTYATVINGFRLINGRSDYGGAIYCMQTSPTIINNEFQDNSAAYGGAIYAENGSPLIAGNAFTHNGFGQASGSSGPDAIEGGAVNLHTSASLVQENLFTDNRAGWSGAGLFTSYSSSLTLYGNLFDSGAADAIGGLGFGGALGIIKQSSVVATFNSFTDNTAVDSGGAVWLSGGAPAASQFDNNLFDGNEAYFHNGGAMLCDNCSATFFNDTFTNNRCDEIGGALCCNGAGSSTIYASHFSHNVAWYHGGAIACANDANATLSRNDISSNDIVDSTGSGAGVYVLSASVTIRRNLIQSNGTGTSPSPASLCFRGGGIDYVGGATTSNNGIIESNVVLGNQVYSAFSGFGVGEGAGVALMNMGVGSRFVSNVVARNFATAGGCKCAGVLIQENGTAAFPAAFRFVNNTIAYNQNGASTFIGTGGGVMFENVTSHFVLENCIIWANLALNNTTNDPVVHSIGVPSLLTPTLNYCDVSAAGPNFLLAWQWAANPVTFNVNPVFVDGVRNYHLQATSTLINVGDNAVIVPADIDMDGTARINPTAPAVVDIGADET